MGFDVGENDKGEMLTIKGWVDKHFLTRKLIVEDRPNMYVVSVEWTNGGEVVRRDALVAPKSPIPGEDESMVNTVDGLRLTNQMVRNLIFTEDDNQFTIIRTFHAKGTGGKEMRRDTHIILKHATETATAVAMGVGG